MNKRQRHCDKRLESRLESLENGLRAALREHVGRLTLASADDPVEFMDMVARGETVDLAVSIAELDGVSMFARIDDGDGDLIAVRAYFPATVPGAVPCRVMVASLSS